MLERFFIVNDKVNKAYQLIYDDYMSKQQNWSSDELVSAHSHLSTFLFEREALNRSLLDYSKGVQEYKFLDYYYEAALSYAKDLETHNVNDASQMKANIYQLMKDIKTFSPSAMEQMLIELEIKSDNYLALFGK